MKQDNYILIDKYFEDSLSSEEQNIFNEKLENDADFSSAFQMEKEIHQGMEAYGNRELKVQLDRIHAEEIEKKQKPKEAKIRSIGSRFQKLAIAASFLIICGVAFWLLNSGLNGEQAYQAYYSTPSFESLRSGENSDALLAKAKVDFNNKAYGNSLNFLETYLQNNPNDGQVKLLVGICQLELNQNKAAIKNFKEVIEMPNSDFEDQATWYLALSYLKENNIKTAKSTLQNIISGAVGATPKMQSKATKLLEELK